MTVCLVVVTVLYMDTNATAPTARRSTRLMVHNAHTVHADTGKRRDSCALCSQVGASVVSIEESTALLTADGRAR